MCVAIHLVQIEYTMIYNDSRDFFVISSDWKWADIVDGISVMFRLEVIFRKIFIWTHIKFYYEANLPWTPLKLS